VRQKQWEIEQARTAPEAPPSIEEEEQDVKSGLLQGKGFEDGLAQAS